MAGSTRCNICEVDFKNISAITSHLRWNHDIRMNYSCKVCSEGFVSKKDLIAHCKLHRKPGIPLKCPICNGNFEKKLLKGHFKKNHSIAIEEENLHFGSIEDFYKWKKSIESETISYFVMRTTAVKTKLGVTKTYVCHRSGNYISRGENKKKIKSIGSNRINGHCPAKLTVRCLMDKVSVHFIKTHVGHSMDLERLIIPKEEKEKIAERIASKIPFDDILGEIKDSASVNKLKRLHLINRKDLHNIVQKYSLNKEVIRKKTNSFRADLWMHKLPMDTKAIRFIKEKGCSESCIQVLEKSDFFLVFANEIQLKFLMNYGNGTVGLDVTTALNYDDYKLFTLLVLDENQAAFPCAFMISNKYDTKAMMLFFNVIKDCLPSPICPHYFISNNSNNNLFSAWTKVMPNGLTRLIYNIHSLEQEWKLNLSSIPNEEKQENIYKLLKSLIEESNLNVFVDRSNEILRQLYSVNETVKFAKYIERFLTSPTSWAYCFRTDMRNVNIAQRNMSKISELLYFQRRNAKGIDNIFHSLMRCFKNRLFNFLKYNKRKDVYNFSYIADQHRLSLELINQEVYILNDKWHVPSDNSSDRYEVVPCCVDCDCKWKCEECLACIHSYSCTCNDFRINWMMCKHIHLVATFVKYFAESENVMECAEPLAESDKSSINFNNMPETEDFLQETDIFLQHPKFVEDVISSSKITVSVEDLKQSIKDKFLDTLNNIETLEEVHILEHAITPAKEMISKLKKS